MTDTTVEKDCKLCKNNYPSYCHYCKDKTYFAPIYTYENLKVGTPFSLPTFVDESDTGKRTEFNTGAIRETNENRGRFDLISAEGLRRLALRYEFGSKKYSDRNWEKGLPTSNCLNSMFRHMVEYMMGMDEEDHLAAIAWNAFAIMHFERYKPELQNIESRLKREKEE